MGEITSTNTIFLESVLEKEKKKRKKISACHQDIYNIKISGIVQYSAALQSLAVVDKHS